MGIFFLESVDASNESHDAMMLADLLDQRIEKIGRDKVVQIVTDNGAIYKAAGRYLVERTPTLFWTPCATHCLDLMLTLCDNQDVTVEDVKRDTNLVKFRRWLYPELQPQWEGICVDVENFQLP